MNIPKDKKLSEFTSDYLEENKISKVAFAGSIGVSRTLVSQYLSDKYPSDPTMIEKSIVEYFNGISQENEVEQLENDIVKTNVAVKNYNGELPTFFETNDAINILAICQSCQEFTGLGIVVGRSGYGKTHTLKNYMKTKKVCYLECDDSMTSRDLIEAIEKAISSPKGSGTIWSRVQSIKDFFNVNAGYLLIIDEADKLMTKHSSKKMEILRTIFDQSDVGLVIAGEPALESMLKIHLPRFANRTDYFFRMNGLLRVEIENYIGELNVSETAVNELIHRGTNSNSGCFRLLNRTLKNLVRMITPENVIGIEDIKMASNMMML